MLRTKAQLRIFSSDKHLVELSKCLRRQPDFGYSIGEPISSRANKMRDKTLWGLSTTQSNEDRLNAQITLMVNEFSSIKWLLEKECATWCADILCFVSSDNGQASIEIDPDLSGRLSELGLGLVFDVYNDEEGAI